MQNIDQIPNSSDGLVGGTRHPAHILLAVDLTTKAISVKYPQKAQNLRLNILALIDVWRSLMMRVQTDLPATYAPRN